MPELPEVELIRKGIEERLLNQRLLEIRVIEPFSILYKGSRMKNRNQAENILNRVLKNRTLKSCHRKGKLLILGFDRDLYLIIHLKMTGNLSVRSSRVDKNLKHDRIIFKFEKETVVFNDVRKFGYVEVVSGNEVLKKKLQAVGIDALTELNDEKTLEFQLQRSSMPVKKFLLSQKYISGIGNAYSDEILFEAGISPMKPANALKSSEIGRLFFAIRKKLDEGIRSGGLTLRDYRNFYGEKGSFQEKLNVYGRYGEECLICRGLIEKMKIGGRSSYFCRNCQK